MIRGIVQLADSTELRPHLPSDLEPVLQALLSYRNNILHNGLEWPVERREKFANQVTRWPKGWFQKAESNHKPWVWYMSEAFIQRVFGVHRRGARRCRAAYPAALRSGGRGGS
ncbi:hypothetical protein [Sphingobium sp. YC-XJ3]|uniref:hypothetical protein n=1 Tax=Sphingobium sp. YC-XJ3 TaxID=3024245 RepID=UPI00235E20AD|nr:hypothetical protein [Sphingobium sp. YC-XJ3]WDA36138.1 hypothetical protein PO876_22310 [Sphingobium sp. YC-XJ3]